MTAEDPGYPWVSSPVGEVKLIPLHEQEEEGHSCNQEVMLYQTDTPCEECTGTDSQCSEEPFCRICHEGQDTGELLSLCECSGSLAMVHQTCLEHWLTASNRGHCELCHHQFAMERLPKPLTEWLCSPLMQQQRRTLCTDAVCFLFITPLASLSGWLCVHGALDLYYTNGMEALGLLFLTLALFTIYIFWTVVSVRYYMHLFKTWKMTDQRVRLQIPLSAQSTHNQQSVSINTLTKATNKETMV
ncbi:E3 ubiquitin-protein ligase MARCHF3 [Parambassis ranga]|uniref:E3 ubiquitin-protein ligase MARCHF3 n=1 Tax=Parambassis ranga TaxID=210632 RepID=A0A6P7I0S4_9TELE|nr:E3 ubiquitin-protein ligase MARCH3-like [Parambassis ranga]